MLKWLPSFQDELTKIAGVGWDIHGYDKSTTEMDKEMRSAAKADSDWDNKFSKELGNTPSRFKEKVIQPGFFGRLFGEKSKRVETGEKNPDFDKWQEKYRSFLSKNPSPKDPWDIKDEARVKTPFDMKTNYKLNMAMDYDRKQRSGALSRWTTDEVYGDTPTIKNLSKEQFKKVVKDYKQAAKDYNQGLAKKDKVIPAHVIEGQQAFLAKADHLMNDPKVKILRLEHE